MSDPKDMKNEELDEVSGGRAATEDEIVRERKIGPDFGGSGAHGRTEDTELRRGRI